MKAMDPNCLDREDLRHLSDAGLERLGVRLLNRQDVVLQCRHCMETWSPQLDYNGKLPFGYWICPAKCNERGV